MLETTASDTGANPRAGVDTPRLRKARGAFFTPAAISRFITRWAVRAGTDRVLEPAAGDAAFLTEAVARLAELDPDRVPEVDGVEIHGSTAALAEERVAEAGGRASIRRADFFSVPAVREYAAVIGNPPFIRYQDFAGEARARSLEAALAAGVSLSRLSSSWAAFTVHATSFLSEGGRLGLVLPAELLSVNYAGAVRRFLFERFAQVELVMFEEQVFPEVEADVVLLLADGFGQGPAAHATVRHVRNAEELSARGNTRSWTPSDPTAKWTTTLVEADLIGRMAELEVQGLLAPLEEWGDTTLGMVTGNNKYFALSPERASSLGLPRRDLLKLSPPGSAHLRGLSLSARRLGELGRNEHSTLLFRPQAARSERLAPASAAYVEAGEQAGVDRAYKCRIRTPWYRVPLLAPADILLTCMNADAPRMVSNLARAHHLNSVHGVYLRQEYRELAVELLPLAALNSAALLSAELVGRSYGGGILKLEPREADRWAMPAPQLLHSCAESLRALKPAVSRLLARGQLLAAAEQVDRVLLLDSGVLSANELEAIRGAHATLMHRRRVRGRSGR